MQGHQDIRRGRGAASNPPNRFTPLWQVRDPDWTDAEDPAPTTRFLKDFSHSIIASNSSPDVGFERSINPYRGCEHGCVYCLAGDTPILMADGTTRQLAAVRVGDAIYGTIQRGHERYYVKTCVLAHWQTCKPAYRITLEDGTCLVAGGEHRFLTERGWTFVTDSHLSGQSRPHLSTANSLLGTGAFTPPPTESQEYKQGYLCGLIRGDGYLVPSAYEREGSAHGKPYHFRLALTDQEALERASRYLVEYGVTTPCGVFRGGAAARQPLQALRTPAQRQAQRMTEIIAWPSLPAEDWQKGFLAGLFDARGSYRQHRWRLTTTDEVNIAYTSRCLESFGFTYVVEYRATLRGRPLQVVRLCGGLREHLRFFHTVDPAMRRKQDIAACALQNNARLRIVAIEPLALAMPLFDITTGTGDFIANGMVSHNCYARPTHEYLGFSAGLDFETQILVKPEAPALLRRELASPRWQPQVVAMSGVTDCYQPVERRLQLTRRCLEVFVEFRNPVAIVTKSALVLRDLDLLTQLAQYQAVAVCLSVTTLDSHLARLLEPRASQPTRRLAAIAALAQAGVPVGVLVAPVIPGLTEHEIPAIIAAAARVGAQFAGYVPLRLPHAVGELFEDWLTQHFPTKKTKILQRLRALRGGKLNDPRFGSRMQGEGIFAAQIASLFRLACRKAGLSPRHLQLSTAAFRPATDVQLGLFT